MGRIIGALFALPFLYFLLRGRIARRLVAAKLAGLFVLGGLQGALGWYMVESGLETRIEVSQYRLAAHLAMAVVIYLAMLWVALDRAGARGAAKFGCAAFKERRERRRSVSFSPPLSPALSSPGRARAISTTPSR